MAHGPWAMVHGPWTMVHGPWPDLEKGSPNKTSKRHFLTQLLFAKFF